MEHGARFRWPDTSILPGTLDSAEARPRLPARPRQPARDPPREQERPLDPPPRSRLGEVVLLELPPADEHLQRPFGCLDLQDFDRDPRDRVHEVQDLPDPERDVRATPRVLRRSERRDPRTAIAIEDRRVERPLVWPDVTDIERESGNAQREHVAERDLRREPARVRHEGRKAVRSRLEPRFLRFERRCRPSHDQRIERRVGQRSDLVDGDPQSVVNLEVRQDAPVLPPVLLVDAHLEPASERQPEVPVGFTAPGRRLSVTEHPGHDVVHRVVGREADTFEQEVHGVLGEATE
jgi:hypothetical protein